MSVTTRRGIDVEVKVSGPIGGAPLVFFHGFIGPLAGEPLVDALGDAGHRVYAPVWPGYSDSARGEDQLTDMLDFALHGADIVEALRLGHIESHPHGAAHGHPLPHIVGHSMGGMIAAEMAALAPNSYASLVLIAPLGLWLDDHPITDIYTLLPFEFAPLLFHDTAIGTKMMTGGKIDFSDNQAIQRFLIDNSRRLGTASKILFPIPNRRLNRRLYRITDPTLIIWGDDDRLLPAPYASAWEAHLPHARQVVIERAGHMAPYEQTAEVASAIADFLADAVAS